MEDNKEIFDFGFWLGKILSSAYGTPDVINYLNDKSCIAFHVKNKSNDIENKLNQDVIDLFVDGYCKTFAFESLRYLNSHIVYIFCLLENLFEECTYLFIINNPTLLKRVEQINTDFKINSFLKFELLEKFDETHDVIKDISRVASTYIVTGKIENTLMRLKGLIKLEFPIQTVSFCKQLQEYRNHAVHQLSMKDVSVEYFKEIDIEFGIIFQSLETKFKELNITYFKPY